MIKNVYLIFNISYFEHMEIQAYGICTCKVRDRNTKIDLLPQFPLNACQARQCASKPGQSGGAQFRNAHIY